MDDPTQSKPQRWQLRVVNGPARGALHPLRERLVIGRSAQCDVQLVDDSVSRQHARVLTDSNGQHVIVDLGSRNGTVVDGRRIGRQPLAMSSVIEIAGTQLVYEPCRMGGSAMPTTRLFVVDSHNTATSRGTLDLLAVNESSPTAGPPGVPTPVGGGDGPRFERPDGHPYAGELLGDIVDYRQLRAKILRGGLLAPDVRERFGALTERLQRASTPGEQHQRAAIRHTCAVPATLRFVSGEQLPCTIQDLGVDGARVWVEEHRIPPHSIVWLAIEVEGEHSRSVVLAGRVAWAHVDHLGLAFSGAPRSDRGRYDMTVRVPQREELGGDDNTQPITIGRVPVAAQHT